MYDVGFEWKEKTANLASELRQPETNDCDTSDLTKYIEELKAFKEDHVHCKVTLATNQSLTRFCGVVR